MNLSNIMTDLASSASSSRGRTIAYWVTTGLVAAESVLGGVWDILQIYLRAFTASPEEVV